MPGTCMTGNGPISPSVSENIVVAVVAQHHINPLDPHTVTVLLKIFSIK